MLLFRFRGSFLFRVPERRFLGLLFQDPPRRTRESGGGQAPVPGRTTRHGRSRGAIATYRRARHARSRLVSVPRQPVSARCRRASGRAGRADGYGTAPRFRPVNGGGPDRGPGQERAREGGWTGPRFCEDARTDAAPAAKPRSGAASPPEPPGRRGTTRNRRRNEDTARARPPSRNDPGRRDTHSRRTGWSNCRSAGRADVPAA